MFQHNLWFWLLSGLERILREFLSRMPVHSYLGLTFNVTLTVFYFSVIILLIFGTFVHLGWFGVVIILILLLETVRMVIAIGKWLWEAAKGIAAAAAFFA